MKNLDYGLKNTIKFPFEKAIEVINSAPENSSIYIGCDSLPKGRCIEWITVMVIHFGSNAGGSFVFSKHIDKRKTMEMRERLWTEVSLASEIALELAPYVEKRNFKFEIHLDLNPNNKSSCILKEAVGYITGLGFEAKVKPEAFAASSVADMRVRK